MDRPRYITMTYDVVGLDQGECMDYMYSLTHGDVLIGLGNEEKLGFMITVHCEGEMQKFMEIFLQFQKKYPTAKLFDVEVDVYYGLTIVADDDVEVWLACDEGHLVQKSLGTMVSSLKPGRYKYRFSLKGEDTYFRLEEDMIIDKISKES